MTKKKISNKTWWELAFGPKTDSLVCEFWIPPPDVIWQPMFFSDTPKVERNCLHRQRWWKIFLEEGGDNDSDDDDKDEFFKKKFNCLKYLLTLFLLLPLCCCLPPAPPGIWGKGFFWDCPLKLNLEDVPSNQELSEPYSWKDLSCGRKSLNTISLGCSLNKLKYVDICSKLLTSRIHSLMEQILQIKCFFKVL